MSDSIDIGSGKLYMNGEYIGEVNEKATVKPKHSKAIGGITIDVSIEGYDKAKQQLRNLEATMDRILEKQERLDKFSKNIYNANEWDRTMADGRWVKDHQLLERIDTDCGRIVRLLQGRNSKPKTMKVIIDGKLRNIDVEEVEADKNKTYTGYSIDEYLKRYQNK